MAKQNLTPKQEKAVQEFLINGGNKTAAYRVAYSTSNMKESTINENACRLFANSKVKARLEALQAKLEVKSEVNREWLQEKAKQLIERSLEAEPILTKSGDFTGEFRYDSAGAAKGIDIINKMQGNYAPKKKDVKTTVVIKTIDDIYED